MTFPALTPQPSWQSDHRFMTLALLQAQQADAAGEVPVGAVVVKDGKVIGVGYNTPRSLSDPCAHAEIVALRAASAAMKNYRLEGCTLFVTLEPCAMCAGAIFSARLARVVYGAMEPKTGAAGSVVNLFENPQLNHQTHIQGGLMADECSHLLSRFFLQRRQAKQRDSQPLRDDALRTPDRCFDSLPGYPWSPHYVSNLPALNGLRLHYLDEGPHNAPLTWLCLHDSLTWSYLYRKMLPVFLAAGHRVIAPDLIGFGRSDKPKKEGAHSLAWHRQVLAELVEQLDLHHVVLVVQEERELLGLTLPVAQAHRYCGLIMINTVLPTGEVSDPLSAGLRTGRKRRAQNFDNGVSRRVSCAHPEASKQECDAYASPFPDAGHQAALRYFASRVPESEGAEGAEVSRLARDFWQSHWTGQSLMVISTPNSALGGVEIEHSHPLIRNCPPPMLLAEAGRFLPEQHGEALAHAAIAHITNPFHHATLQPHIHSTMQPRDPA